MKTNKAIIILFLMVGLCGSAMAFARLKWMTQANINVEEAGLIETILPMEAHRASSEKHGRQTLDLNLTGPDGRSRAFELFWASEGEVENVAVAPENVELLDDKRLLWEAPLREGNDYSGITIRLTPSSYAGKVEIEGLEGDTWTTLARGLPIAGLTNEISFKFMARKLKKIRLHFSGYDRQFAETPIFVTNIELLTQKPGSKIFSGEMPAVFEESAIEGGIELRVFLPGSGLHLTGLEINTEAQFKGKWQLGREHIELGKREFKTESTGSVKAVSDDAKSLFIGQSGFWGGRVILVRLFSDDYFGKVTSVKVRALMPRILFNAETTGEYYLQTGIGREVVVSSRPQADVKATVSFVECGKVRTNADWQAENLLQDYSIKGGPFSAAGYAWQADFSIEKPGFFQLVTSSEVALEKYRQSLRIVKNDVQIPFFLGRRELREIQVSVEKSVDPQVNRSIFLVRLPESGAALQAISFKARGVFDRRISFERHFAGKVGWQSWQQRRWSNNSDREAKFTFYLQDFPMDQKELRILVDHGNNQAIDFNDFQGLISAQDLFFVATEAGGYKLFGGNDEVFAPVYDLAIVQNKLLEMFPEKVKHSEPVKLVTAEVKTAAVEQGAAFNDSGYTWVATFPVDVVGLYQLNLNRQASLDDNRAGLRLVKNGLQVPYFWGQKHQASMAQDFSINYEKGINTTYCQIKLVTASRNWRSLVFHSSGVFKRRVELQIRKPGKMGWQVFHTAEWISQQSGSTSLNMAIDLLPVGETELQLVISHGDNQPIEIQSVVAVFESQSLLFNAVETGEYKLFGGNSKARAPVYDLALIKNSLLKSQPRQIQLGEPESFKGRTDVQKHLEETFSETGWGLYIVLGLVTAILIILIVKLFPEEQPEKESQEKTEQDKE